MRRFNFSVVPILGPGIIPGARWLAQEAEGSTQRKVLIRTSFDREVALTRNPDGTWATIPSFDEVVVVALSAEDPGSAEVLGFHRQVLLDAFDAVLRKRKKQDRNVTHKIPIFVDLDTKVPGQDAQTTLTLKDQAAWRELVPFASVPRNKDLRPESTAAFIERVKHEYARLNGVEVSKVTVEFRITG